MESLALGVNPIVGECATSLASRLAARNGEPRLRRFCTHMSLPIKELRLGERGCLLPLSKLSGRDLGALRKASPCQKEAGYFDLGAERIKFPAFLRTTMRVCPVCVQESGFHQKGLWQLEQIRVCPTHLCLLQSLPRPKLADDQLDVVTCARTATLGSVAFVKRDVLGLQNLLLDRLAGRKSGTWLDDMPFHVVALTSEAFGLMLSKGAKTARGHASDLDWVIAGDMGVTCLRDGPDAFCAALQKIENTRSYLNAAYRSRFEVFFEWLRDRSDDVSYDPFRDLMREFVFRSYPIAKGTQVLGVRNPERLVHDHKSMAKEMRINRASLGGFTQIYRHRWHYGAGRSVW